MIALREKIFAEVASELRGFNTLGLVSCGGCPAVQKKGGKIGITRWQAFLEEQNYEIKWAFVAPWFCDERLFQIHLKELAQQLDAVDAVVLMACEAGTVAARRLLGFECINCLHTEFFGIMRFNGKIDPFEIKGAL
jgi:hypothetical protein